METMSRYFEFLDALRLSGAVNMYGAAPNLQAAFGLDRDEARKVADAWRKTFNNVQTPAERAAQVRT